MVPHQYVLRGEAVWCARNMNVLLGAMILFIPGCMQQPPAAPSNVYPPILCCYCSHINSHKQVRGHRTGSSHSGGAEEYPKEKTQTTQGGTRIYHS